MKKILMRCQKLDVERLPQQMTQRLSVHPGNLFFGRVRVSPFKL
jgi:hypothetical protein